jgi:hypothetical protein
MRQAILWRNSKGSLKTMGEDSSPSSVGRNALSKRRRRRIW